jgi:hypothetical protein
MYFKGFILASIIALVGGIFMAGLFGCSPAPKLDKYISKDSMIGIESSYVSGWKYSESRGARGSYAQVVFYNPSSAEKDIGSAMIFTAEDKQLLPAGINNINAMADDIVRKRSRLNSSKLLDRKNLSISGKEAVMLVLSYKKMDKLLDLSAKLIPIKEKVFIMENRGKFYTLRYENNSENYEKLNKVFDQIVKSIRFSE